MNVKVFFNNRPDEMYGGIEGVFKRPDEIILVPYPGSVDRAPRIVIDRDAISGWHEIASNPSEEVENGE